MSRKWQRVKRWDAENLTGWLSPVRWVLHTFSSIWFAVVLLVFVALWGVLASIPIGLLAMTPTMFVIVGSCIACVVIAAALAGVSARAAVPASRRGLRFSAMMIVGLVGGVLGAWGWWAGLRPMFHYDPVSGEGFRLFADFIARYDSTTLRRLPGVELTELEFYSWWPLRVVLIMFVLNLTTATLRRIEFTFKNLGVLTVHTGIIVIALGSVYYQAMKKEGDALLRAGMPDESGRVTVGAPVRGFYDNTAVALWVAQRTGVGGSPLWEARRLSGVPRYNDYALDAAPAIAEGARVIGPAERVWSEPQRRLDLPVPGLSMIDPALDAPRVDPDIRFRVVGYAEYANPAHSLIVVEGEALDRVPPARRTPIRVVDLLSRLPDERGGVEPDRPAFSFTLRPNDPVGRISRSDAIAVEYTIGMEDGRFASLLAALPPGTEHGLVVEIPGAAAEDGSVPRVVLPAEPGVRHEIGETGWKIGVKQVMPQPPFPIITRGYEGADSSVVIAEITPPEGEPFERWIYHRFPRINQDISGTAHTGRQVRTEADDSIRVWHVDASRLQLYFNEREGGEIDLVVREPAGAARLYEGVGIGDRIGDVVEMIDFRVSAAHRHAEVFEHPVPVPELERNKQFVGSHTEAMLAVEITCQDVTSPGGEWSTVVWVPFAQYLGIDPSGERVVDLPGGRSVTLQFGRVWHGFPGFVIQLVDFQMIAYDHRGSPRDYQSIVRVSPISQQSRIEPYEHVTKLNAPLRAPYIWSENRSLLGNVALRLTSGLNPNQFKLSQSGWDRDGWMQTQQMADAGQVARPFARYTILQVGNNPGIHVIALGGIMMGVGIPWAFYVKPWLIRREKRALAEAARSRARGPVERTEQGEVFEEIKEGAAEPARQP